MTSISTLWKTLDTTVRQWLLQNPGTMVLPRTYVNMVTAGAGHDLHLDAHGEYWLTPEDIVFMKTERNDARHPAVLGQATSTKVAASSSTGLHLDPDHSALHQ